jgi:hypothetical protein
VSKPTPDSRSDLPGSTSWVKSSLSFANSNCVEVANLPGRHVGVRDSKAPEDLVLRFTPDEWRAFLGGVRMGEFDRFGELSALRGKRLSLLSNLAVLARGRGSQAGPRPRASGRNGLRNQADVVSAASARPAVSASVTATKRACLDGRAPRLGVSMKRP